MDSDSTAAPRPDVRPTGASPLAGVRVLDLSRVLAGPYCTMLLADLGATVWKLEPPHGDDTRSWGPPFVGDGDTQESAYFLAVNRGKHGLAVDLKHPDGRAVARRLAAAADVVLENGKVGDAARFGLDYATLAADRDDLVYCSISGYGQSGPRAHDPGYDAAIQAATGLMAMTGETGGRPVKVGVALVDVLTGVHAATGIAAALAQRAVTGRGAYLELSLFETALASFVNQTQAALVTDAAPARLGSAHPSIVPYQAFEAADGEVMIAVGNDKQFRALATAVGRPAWAEDPRYATNPARVEHREALVGELAAIVATRTRDAWVEALHAAGVPATPVATLPEALRDPQVAARGTVASLDHPVAGRVEHVVSPIRFAGGEGASAPGEAASTVSDGGAPAVGGELAPPQLGEHTRDVLRDIGLGDDEIERLADAGAIVVR